MEWEKLSKELKKGNLPASCIEKIKKLHEDNAQLIKQTGDMTFKSIELQIKIEDLETIKIMFLNAIYKALQETLGPIIVIKEQFDLDIEKKLDMRMDEKAAIFKLKE